jgi:hypothetical protein
MPSAPNPLAVAAIRAKTPVGSPLNTEGWSRVPLALRESAQFSARVESLRLLQRIQERIETTVSMARRPGEGKDGGPGAYQTREKFIAEMQKIAREEGLDPRNENRGDLSGGLQDVTSFRRQALIYDTQIENVQEFAKWQMDQDPDVLNAYPAQELIRVSERKAKRDWKTRWLKAGGRLHKGRMVALKTDPVWKKLSRFGKPWPPFDFGSGMGLRDLSRREAVSLGVLKKGEEVKPIKADFTDKLQASVKDLGPRMQSALQRSFGDQVVIEGGVAKWQGSLIQDFFDRSLADSRQWKGEINLGAASGLTVNKAAAAGQDLQDWELTLAADDLRHAVGRHGEADALRTGSGETNPTQIPITRADFEALPHVWRNPDSVLPGAKPGSLVFVKDMNGDLYTVTWERSAKGQLMRVKTLYKKRAPGA